MPSLLFLSLFNFSKGFELKSKVITIESERISDSKKLKKLVKELTALNSNLMVFGLPYSGKSYLIKAICDKDKKFITLEDEEVTEDRNGEKIKEEIGGRKWAVGHQFPTQSESVSDEYLADFLVKKMDLNPEKWLILRIKTK